MGQFARGIGEGVREDHRDRAGLAAARSVILVPFAGNVDEARRADPDAGRARNLPAPAAVEPGMTVVVGLAVAALQLDIVAIVAHAEIHAAGNPAGAILRGRAVAEHLEVP